MSAFNKFLQDTVTPETSILLLTFVNNLSEDEVSSSIALDFSHKIK